eukprot:1733285-Prymnesium_polylepis.2
MSSRAIAQLVANPPPKVGVMQQRTAKWMLRPCDSAPLRTCVFACRRLTRACVLLRDRSAWAAFLRP